MALQGKGQMIWKIPNCEGGSPTAIAAASQAAGLSHVLIKIADGNYTYNVDKTSGADLVPAVREALRAYGIQVWGWHYVYGYDPAGEARIAIQRVNQLGLDGYVIDAETEYKQPGRDAAARKFMIDLRAGLPNTPVALCSYRFPSYHPQFPWKDFLDKCDYNMPQVYWLQAHNPGAQLTRSVREFQAMTPYRPYLATGPLFSSGGWAPSESEMLEFLNTATSFNISAVNFFAFDYKKSLKSIWDLIAAYPYGPTPSPQDLPAQFINALNSHNVDQVVALYTPDAVRVTAAQTMQGTSLIRNWFTTFINTTLPSGVFKLTGSTGSGTTRTFTWTATSSAGRVQNGSDTIGILDGKIAYHYSFFTIT